MSGGRGKSERLVTNQRKTLNCLFLLRLIVTNAMLLVSEVRAMGVGRAH